MRRVPLPIVIILCLMVVGGTWWYGTKDYDFIAPPPPEEIIFAGMRAAGELATPSDLFAVETLDDDEKEPVAPAEPPPKPPRPTPVIDPGELGDEPRLDSWVGESGKPAASFINLASKLESETELQWALIAWERVLDHSSPNDDERAAAVSALRRLHASLSPWNEDPEKATRVTMVVEAPADRIKLSTQAAKSAAELIDESSSGLLRISALVRKAPPTPASPKITVHLETKATEDPASVAIPAPESAADIEKTILTAVFKLVGSQLALETGLEPVSTPDPGEPPADSLKFRITRLSWQEFARTFAEP